MENISTIILPTRPQPDTVVAIFLIKQFGREKFPGIDTATVRIQAMLKGGETFESLLAQGIVVIDIGGSPFDHHNKNDCASELVAKYLNIANDPALAQLLQYAKRDDKEGKGTASKDAIDRAFGLSGLVASLNKVYSKDPQKIIDILMPLLEAHYISAREHHVELPRDIEQKKSEGNYEEFFVKQGEKNLKVVCLISDKPSMPGYLRSMRGGRADVVVLKLEGSNHISILTKQEKKVDLSKIMGLIRLREAQLNNVELSSDDEAYVTQTGRIPEVSNWYYDPATNSVLNGGPHNKEVKESAVSWQEIKGIVKAGLEIGGEHE